MKKITLILILVLFVSLLAYASPQGKFIGYSGYLEENSGFGWAPVTDWRDFQFTIYWWDATILPDGDWVSTGWSEEYADQDGSAGSGTDFAIWVDEGQFSVKLGSRTSFDTAPLLDFSSDVQYGLKVEVKDNQPTSIYGTFEGTKSILFVPYSLGADDAEGVLGERPTIIQVLTQLEEDNMTPVTGQIWMVE